MRFWSELKRRKVFRVAAVYAATAFAVLEAVDLVLPRLGVPDWAMTFLVVLVLAGFPIALVLAWALELTPEGGLKRTEAAPAGSAHDGQPLFGGRTLVATALLVALGVGLSAGWLLRPVATGPGGTTGEGAAATGSAAEGSGAPGGAADARPSVAVLPFDNLSTDPEQGYFADGLTEEILNALAGLPNLFVTARTSSFYYKDRDVPVDEIADRLGVDHVLEGSVRRSGDELRVTAQLVRASDGFHVWSDTYDRPVDDAFRVQSDISTQVASALGILLDEQARARMEEAGVHDPEAYALYARGYEQYQLAHTDAPQIPTLIAANELFDQAFDLAPGLWVARFHSADLYSHILLDLAEGSDPASLPAVEVARARAEHGRRLREAARAAPGAAARDFIEFTRQVFSDDWTGLAELTRRVLDHTGACSYDQWTHLVGPALGMAAPAREFMLRGTRCNGIDPYNWQNAAVTSLYLGEPERALEILDEAEGATDMTGTELFRVEVLLALGRFDEARQTLARLPEGQPRRVRGEAWIAAARGDSAATAGLRDRIMAARAEEGLWGLPVRLSLAARLGDREGANRIASAVDARPAGPTSLLLGIYFCLCGAPFDLEAAPNLAARLEEAGLAWPPTASLEWPLKRW